MQATWIRSAALAAACLCGMAAPMAQTPVFQQPPAQSQTAGPATGMIAGNVIDSATKKPIAGAMVALAGNGGGAGRGGARQMQTDSQGRFAFVALTAGRYSVISQQPGYSSGFTTSMRPIDLKAEERISDFVVRLHPLIRITGTVIDETGEPVTGVGVSAFRQMLFSGRQIMTAVSEARTDDRGEYRLTNLTAGDYLVCACRRDQIPFDGVLLTTLAAEPAKLLSLAARALKVGGEAASIENMRATAPTFHPSSPTMARAAHVVVAEGETRANIDIQVPIVRLARISGTIIGAPGAVSANQVRLRPTGELPEAAAAIEPMLVQPDGRFDFAGIPPGTYVLSVWMSSVPAPVGSPSGAVFQLTGGRGGQQVQSPMDAVVSGYTTVVVGDTDLTGVTVNLRRAAKVTARIEAPADAAPRTPQQQQSQFVRLVPLSPELRGGGQPVRPDASGVFPMPSAGPGKYFIEIGTSLQIAKITVSGIDVTDMPIDVGDTDIADVVVSLVAPTRTMITGTVQGSGADTTVLIFPADPRLWAEPAASRRWFATAPADKSGKFSTAPILVPGKYLVAAVSDDQAVDWLIQTRLQALAPRAQSVTVAAGETKTIEVKR